MAIGRFYGKCSFNIPYLLTEKQTDLGNTIIIEISGLYVLLLSVISWKLVLAFFSLRALSTPIFWHYCMLTKKS